MSFLFSSNKDEKASLIIDIGNSTVTSSVVVFKNDELPRFIYNITNSYEIQDKVDSVHLVESLISILDFQLNKLSKEAFNHKYWIKKKKRLFGAEISFSSPWFVLKTKHLFITHEKEFIISSSFLEDVILKEEEAFKYELYPKNPNLFQVVEKNILHTKIKGYDQTDIVNKKTNNLEAYLSMSAIDSMLLDKILNIILKYTHIPREELRFNTFPIVSSAVIRDFFTTSGDFIIFDISGDVMDITLVQESVIKKTVSVPCGKNNILRRMAKDFNVSVEIAESMFNMFNSDKSTEEINKKIEDQLVSIGEEWSIHFKNALLELSPNLSLPTNVFLMADSNVSHIYSKFIKSPVEDETSVFRKLSKVTIVDNEMVSKFFKNETTEKITEFSVLISIFYKKIFNNSIK